MNLILGRTWVFGRGSLCLQRWNSDFNPRTVKLTQTHFWVMLKGFPLELWYVEIFVMLANQIGRFIYFDEKSIYHDDKWTAWVLTEIDADLGLLTEVSIN